MGLFCYVSAGQLSCDHFFGMILSGWIGNWRLARSSESCTPVIRKRETHFKNEVKYDLYCHDCFPHITIETFSSLLQDRQLTRLPAVSVNSVICSGCFNFLGFCLCSSTAVIADCLKCRLA